MWSWVNVACNYIRKSLIYTPNFLLSTSLSSLSLILWNLRERMFLVWILLLVIMFPSHISWGSSLKLIIKEFKPHARTHHIDIIVITIILCHVDFEFFPIVTCYTNSLYYASTSTLYNSLISHALRLLRSVILRKLECRLFSFSAFWKKHFLFYFTSQKWNNVSTLLENIMLNGKVGGGPTAGQGMKSLTSCNWQLVDLTSDAFVGSG